MKAYLSHGMGMNSTALMLLLEDRGMEYEAVFVNHGGDYPETYTYCRYLQDQGYPITVLIPNVEGYTTLEEYCLAKEIVPLNRFRWCTDKFKLRVLRKYIQVPSISYIGISYEERNRAAKGKSLKKGNINRYPLIEEKITRARCKEFIKDYGLVIPPRSACWFCPYAPISELVRLRHKHPDLAERRKRIYETAHKAYFRYKHNTKLTDYVNG